MSEKKYLPEHIDTYEELVYTFAEFRVDGEKTRFFVDQDYDGPKAFVINRNGLGEFEVYKMKANGEKAVKYQGFDEAYAVNEFYQKFLEEVSKRPEFARKLLGNRTRTSSNSNIRQSGIKEFMYMIMGSIGLMIMLLGTVTIAKDSYNNFVHRKDGYYQTHDNTYYRLGRKMYYYDRILNDWYYYGYYNDFDNVYDDWDYYYDYDDGSNYNDFRDTQYYDDYLDQIDDSSGWSDSDSWDSWDSDFSDWDSDW